MSHSVSNILVTAEENESKYLTNIETPYAFSLLILLLWLMMHWALLYHSNDICMDGGLFYKNSM